MWWYLQGNTLFAMLNKVAWSVEIYLKFLMAQEMLNEGYLLL